MLKEWIQANKFPLAVLAIGTVMSFAVGIALTGDVTAAHRR